MSYSPPPESSYRHLSPRRARLVLAAFALLTILGVGITLSPLRSGYADAPDRGPGDLTLYGAEIARIRGGEDYYQAANAELREMGYPTRSIFNWRTPLPMWLIGKLPHPQMGRCLLAALALAAVFHSFTLLEGEGHVWQGVVCGLLMIGALLPCLIDNLYVAPELWAGTLITLSLAAYGRNRTLLAVALGAAALFFRDIAAPFCLVMGLSALAQQRWREVGYWGAALVAYAIFFAVHVANVMPFVQPSDRAHPGSWLQLGGLAFVLSTCQMNVYLLLSPQWLTAIYFALAMLGLAGWQGENGRRIGLALCTYVALLAAVGHPFNQYWGSLFAPLLCFGVAKCPMALADLWRAAGMTEAFREPPYSAASAEATAVGSANVSS